jgi:phosphoserine aminotransferase
MNVTFNLPSKELEAKFVEEGKQRGLGGLKGHRSVGGIRASIYNAMPWQAVKRWRSLWKSFIKRTKRKIIQWAFCNFAEGSLFFFALFFTEW